MNKKDIIKLLEKQVIYYLEISRYYYNVSINSKDKKKQDLYEQLSNSNYNVYCIIDSILQRAKEK